jgi:hypothetical protein
MFIVLIHLPSIHTTKIGWLAISHLRFRAVVNQLSTLHLFEGMPVKIKKDFQFLQPDRRKLLERLGNTGWGVIFI